MVLTEAREALRSRDDAYRILGRSKRDELFEAAPDAMTVDNTVLEELIEEGDFENVCHETASKFMETFRNSTLKFLAKSMNQHGMSDSTVTARELDNNIMDFADDSFNDEEMQVASELAFALQKYAKVLAKVSASASGGFDARTAGDEEFMSLHSDED